MSVARPHHPTGDLDPFFTFDDVPVDQPEPGPPEDRRPTTYWSVARGERGPEPVPDWLVLDAGAVDTGRDVLKTGKEADVFLLERRSAYGQVRDVVLDLAGLGLAHGDLSPYNLLLHRKTVLVIDLPQVVDLVVNPRGVELLHRDCVNVAGWFTGRGLRVDPDVLLAEAVSVAL